MSGIYVTQISEDLAWELDVKFKGREITQESFNFLCNYYGFRRPTVNGYKMQFALLSWQVVDYENAKLRLNFYTHVDPQGVFNYTVYRNRIEEFISKYKPKEDLTMAIKYSVDWGQKTVKETNKSDELQTFKRELEEFRNQLQRMDDKVVEMIAELKKI